MVLLVRVRPMAGADGCSSTPFLLTFILAVPIWARWPSSFCLGRGTLVGISMLFSGVSRILRSLATRRIVAPGVSE